VPVGRGAMRGVSTRHGRYHGEDFTQFGGAAACDDARMGHVVWSVRQGGRGEFNAPELLAGYRSANPIHEPRLGDVLQLPDGSGPWRVVDWAVGHRANARGNVLLVESVADQAA
jgi:hypothetical protein